MKERGSKKIGGQIWTMVVAPAVVIVIGAFATAYFNGWFQPPPPPPPPAVTTFEGMVYSGEAPVAQALVAVSLTGSAGANGAIHDITDDNGAYKIELTGLPQGTGATLSVAAKGFESAAPKVLAVPLQTDVRVDIPLSPVVVAGVTAPPAAAPPPAQPGAAAPQPAAATEHPLHPVQTAVAHRPVYVPKSAALAMKFQIKAK